MVIDIAPRKLTLESAYYNCIIECHDAINNGMITMLCESAQTEVLTEGFKDTLKNIITSIITALRNLKNKIVAKFKEIKAKLKGNKAFSDKVDEGINQVENAFETEKSEFETFDFETFDIEGEKEKLQKKADKSAKKIKRAGQSASNDIAKAYQTLYNATNDIDNINKKTKENVDKMIQSSKELDSLKF